MKKTLFLILLSILTLPKTGFNQFPTQFPNNFYRHANLPLKVWDDSIFISDFHFLNAEEGFLFTRYRIRQDSNLIIWKTLDGGQTWNTTKLDQYCFQSGLDGKVLQTSPSGRIYFTTQSIHSTFLCDPNNGGLRHQLFYSEDFGVTWQKETIGNFDEYSGFGANNPTYLVYRELSDSNFIFQKETLYSLCGNYPGVYVGNDLSNPIHLNGDTPVDIVVDKDSDCYWYWSYDSLVKVDANFTVTRYPAYLPSANYKKYSIRVDGESIRLFHEVQDPQSIGGYSSYELGILTINKITGERTYKLYLSSYKRKITQVENNYFIDGLNYLDLAEDSSVLLNDIERENIFDDYFVQDFDKYQWFSTDTGYILSYNSQAFNGSPEDSSYILFRTNDGQPETFKRGAIELNASATKILDFSNYVELSPNPSSDYLSIKSVQEIQDIQVINELGQVIMREVELSTDSRLDIRTLPSGIYLLKMKLGNDQFSTKRFIKK